VVESNTESENESPLKERKHEAEQKSKVSETVLNYVLNGNNGRFTKFIDALLETKPEKIMANTTSFQVLKAKDLTGMLSEPERPIEGEVLCAYLDLCEREINSQKQQALYLLPRHVLSYPKFTLDQLALF